MSTEIPHDSQALERRMKVRFDVDELNGFFRRVAPLDMDALWAVLDGEDEDNQG